MDKVLNKIRKSSFKDRIILTGYVSEEEKAGLYKNAEAFLFHRSMRVLEFQFLKVLVMVYRLLLPKILHCRKLAVTQLFILKMSCHLRNLKNA